MDWEQFDEGRFEKEVERMVVTDEEVVIAKFEFKDGWYEPDGIGEYISALSNSAAMLGREEGYLIWGIHNETHDYSNTKLNYHQDVKNEPLEHYLARNVTPGIYFRFDEDVIEGNRVVVLRIPAAHTVPTAYK